MKWVTLAGCHVDLAWTCCAGGLSMIGDDPAMLAATGPLFEGPYEYRRRALLLGGEPS
jgi:hypothetical protein